MDLNNSNLSFCMKVVKTLNDEDAAALTDSMEAYFNAGMPIAQAAPAAVADLLASAESERDNLVVLLRAQHPECFQGRCNEA